ncbi:MAG: uroporphyrinogen decarboxylase [Anaerolineae bacterium]|jgi:uroporphyrinogen decarboxylase|nr:uroporphyrinogen decarboxylase [Anaerolineae bacterium]
MWDRFLHACHGRPVDRTPVWFMRQAGRYMPEYRALRERYGILDLIKAPELATEVTLQPVRALPVDAAIIFADILTLLEGLGLQLAFIRGEGPVIHNPIRSAADVAALSDPPIEESLGYTLEAIRLVRAELDGKCPLIGFSGAPFTLASYAIEGGASRNYERAKGLMWADPPSWDRLMTLLAERVGRYLAAQAAAGAQVLQLFDSWAGALSPADYRRHVLPYSRRAIEIARGSGVPVIHFSTGTGTYLEAVAEAGGDVIGLDWRVDLAEARRRLGDARPVQGNLDPVLLQAPWSVLQAAADAILAAAAGRPGHVFNLGHGILPATPVDQVRRLVEHVHQASERLL